MAEIPGERKIVVGVKQTMRMIEQRCVSEIFIADDADFYVTRPVVEAGVAAGIPITTVDSKKELGHICGIDIGAATACVLTEAGEDDR